MANNGEDQNGLQESNFKCNKNFNKGKEKAISELKKGFWSKCFYAEVELIVKVVQ